MTTIPFPDNPTPQLARFFRNYTTLYNMLSLFGILQGEISNILKNLEQEDLEKATAFSEYLSAIRYENSAKYQYKHTIAEISLSRTVDNFHVYVTDMLRAYFRRNPSKLPQKVKRG